LVVDEEEKTEEGKSREGFIDDGYEFANIEANHTLVVSYGADENGNNIPDDEERKYIIKFESEGRGSLSGKTEYKEVL
jgi:hypothetical protein